MTYKIGEQVSFGSNSAWYVGDVRGHKVWLHVDFYTLLVGEVGTRRGVKANVQPTDLPSEGFAFYCMKKLER